ncbi:hypothetical protein Tco_0657854 [Tanacetum coccineum]
MEMVSEWVAVGKRNLGGDEDPWSSGDCWVRCGGGPLTHPVSNGLSLLCRWGSSSGNATTYRVGKELGALLRLLVTSNHSKSSHTPHRIDVHISFHISSMSISFSRHLPPSAG